MGLVRFFIASSDPVRAQSQQRAMLEALTGEPGSADKIAQFFYSKTRELMAREAWSGVVGQTRSVNVVRDVFRYVPIYWASEIVSRPVVFSMIEWG